MSLYERSGGDAGPGGKGYGGNIVALWQFTNRADLGGGWQVDASCFRVGPRVMPEHLLTGGKAAGSGPVAKPEPVNKITAGYGGMFGDTSSKPDTYGPNLAGGNNERSPVTGWSSNRDFRRPPLWYYRQKFPSITERPMSEQVILRRIRSGPVAGLVPPGGWITVQGDGDARRHLHGYPEDAGRLTVFADASARSQAPATAAVAVTVPGLRLSVTAPLTGTDLTDAEQAAVTLAQWVARWYGFDAVVCTDSRQALRRLGTDRADRLRWVPAHTGHRDLIGHTLADRLARGRLRVEVRAGDRNVDAGQLRMVHRSVAGTVGDWWRSRDVPVSARPVVTLAPVSVAPDDTTDRTAPAPTTLMTWCDRHLLDTARDGEPAVFRTGDGFLVAPAPAAEPDGRSQRNQRAVTGAFRSGGTRGRRRIRLSDLRFLGYVTDLVT